MPPVKFMWYEGGLMPPRPEGLEEDDQLGANGNGILFIGDKGMLTCSGWGGRASASPGIKGRGLQAPREDPAAVQGAPSRLVGRLQRRPGWPAATSDTAPVLTEIGLLGLVAMRVGKKIHWDAQAMKATNAPEADKLLKETYRSGWEVA